MKLFGGTRTYKGTHIPARLHLRTQKQQAVAAELTRMPPMNAITAENCLLKYTDAHKRIDAVMLVHAYILVRLCVLVKLKKYMFVCVHVNTSHMLCAAMN